MDSWTSNIDTITIPRSMASTTTQNTNATKRVETSIPVPSTKAFTAKGDSSGTETKKPYESRKSAEELKLRLASAVTAKIALSKDGNRNLSSTNRGIGLLLQRKEQQEKKLNTKDILFQKTARNNAGKSDGTEKTSNNSLKTTASHMNKAKLQKSLLNALMNSREPSGTDEVQNRAKENRFGVSGNIDRRSTLKSPNDNLANKSKLDNVVHAFDSGQMENAKYRTANKISGSISNTNVKGNANEYGKIPLSTTTASNEGRPSKLQSESENGNANGGILERAKNIERLLGQRKPGDIAHVESKLNGTSLNGESNSKVTTEGTANADGKSSGLKKSETLVRNEVDLNVNKHVNSNKPPGFLSREGNSVLNYNKTLETTKMFNKNEKQGIASVDGTSNEKLSSKKTPPPVAKKPSREDLQKTRKSSPLTTAKQEIDISSNRKISSQNVTHAAHKSISPGSSGKVNIMAKVNGLHDKSESDLLLNREKSRTYAEFSEDLLEKLEASIGSCKIAAFQTIEDFSTLRMKMFRVRSELDQLKRDREKRMPLVY